MSRNNFLLFPCCRERATEPTKRRNYSKKTIRISGKIFKEKIEKLDDILFSKNESLILFKLANVKSRCVFSSNLTLKIVFSNSLQIPVHSLHFFTPLFDCQTDRMSGKLPPHTFLSAYRLLDVISRRGRGHASPDHPRDCHYLRLLAGEIPRGRVERA